MAQNVTVAGASYSDVPSVVLPKTGGGSAEFLDTTISTNAATASDILSGKKAYVNGSLIEGTGTGGGTAAITIDDTSDSHGGTVRTITALDISDTTAVAADVATGKYFYTANGTKTQGTATDSTFVVTLSWDDNDNMWVPDCTWAQLSAAVLAGKRVFAQYDNGNGDGPYNAFSSDIYLYDDGVTLNYAEIRLHEQDNQTGKLYDALYYWASSDYQLDNISEYIYPYFDSPSVTYTPTESQQTDTVTFDPNDYNGIQEVNVTVNAISPSYVGSGITRRDSTSLSANGATVTVPSGYYASQATKSVSTMTLPTAASSTSSGTSKATITPTSSAQYLNIPTGYNDTAQYYTIAASGGTSKNTQVVQGTTRTNSSSMTAIGAEMTVSKTGTYDVYWSAFRNNTSSGYTWTSQLYIDGTAHGTANTSFTNNQQNNHLTNVSLTANQKIRVYGSTTRGSSYYISAPTLVIVEA